MKRYPALALVEFADIPVALRATDAMVKKAPIAVLRCGTVSRGRFLTMIGGTTASVEESLAAGLLAGGPAVLEHLLLPDVHPGVVEAAAGQRRRPRNGALAVVATETATAAVRAAEAALKGTGVELVELRLADEWLAGKGLAIYNGTLHEIEAAMVLARGAVPGGTVSITVIAAPHEGLFAAIAGGTVFAHAALLDLGGEG